jgi:protein-L-isoaspartate(D-aspartate) O-methyltransferase
MTADDKAQSLLEALIAGLKDKGELADPRVEAAFRAVPRHYFLPELSLKEVYADEAVPVKRDTDGALLSSSSQPTMMAMMLRQLRLEPGHNVLEIGAGTGYNAAIMQHIVGDSGYVTTIDLDRDLAEQVERHLQSLGVANVRVVQADGAGGYAPHAAYDRIIATAGVWDIPRAWEEQLKSDGIIVAPLWLDAMQVSAAFHFGPSGTLYSEDNLPCGFIRLRGAGAGPAVSRRLGSSSLILTSNQIDALDMASLHALMSEGVEHDLFELRLDASDYYHGFLPWLVLNVPNDFIFAAYSLSVQEQAYGIEGHGFAIIEPGSACFVPFQAHGEAHSFGAPDAFMTVGMAINAWDKAGRPNAETLRLQLSPVHKKSPNVTTGQVYLREDHYLHAWQAL